MGTFSEAAIREVKGAVDIVDVVSESVSLERTGKEFKGLCPFHEEKTPSFHVSPAKQFYFCHGCGAGGDVLDFVRERERLPFPDAMRHLASRAGIRLEQEDPGATSRRMRIREALEVGLAYFVSELRRPTGKDAREYLAGRGIEPSTMEQFELGWAPEEWEGLLRYARKENVAPEDLEAAGLVRPSKKGHGWYDFFRGRVVFPIRDGTGRLVGFGARRLGEGDGPKYVNSAEGPLFDKGRVLYGLDRAKGAIRRRGACGIVEGYTDVILAHQAGFDWFVAGLGTAFTADHARLVERHAARAVVMLDGDEAGVRSARKVARHLLDAGATPVFGFVPDGRDPADLVREGGAEALAGQLEETEGLVSFCLGRALDGADDTVDRAEAVDGFLELLAGLDHPVKRDDLLREAARRSGTPVEALRERFAEVADGASRATARPGGPPHSGDGSAGGKIPGVEVQVVSLLLDRPEQIEQAVDRIDPTTLTHRVSRRAFRALVEAWDEGGREAVVEVEERILDYEEAFHPKTWHDGRPADEQDASERLGALAEELRAARTRRVMEAKERELFLESAAGDDEREVEALRELQEQIAAKERARRNQKA